MNEFCVGAIFSDFSIPSVFFKLKWLSFFDRCHIKTTIFFKYQQQKSYVKSLDHSNWLHWNIFTLDGFFFFSKDVLNWSERGKIIQWIKKKETREFLSQWHKDQRITLHKIYDCLVFFFEVDFWDFMNEIRNWHDKTSRMFSIIDQMSGDFPRKISVNFFLSFIIHQYFSNNKKCEKKLCRKSTALMC